MEFMSTTLIGIIFILFGLGYGSLAFDRVYKRTLGWLVTNNWVQPPPAPGKDDLKTLLGRKPTIIFYSTLLVLMGIFILSSG